MPVNPTYPGVYIEEIPSGVRTITGVATSITAFIGQAKRGPTDKAITINSFGDFERIFGGLWTQSTLGYAVRDFYLNGGAQAIIVRLYQGETGDGAKPATAELTAKGLTLQAASPGSWGNYVRVRIDHDVASDVATALGVPANELFNLTVRDTKTGATEQFRNVTVIASARQLNNVLKNGSSLLLAKTPLPAGRPDKHGNPAAGKDIFEDDTASTGVPDDKKAVDGGNLGVNNFTGAGKETAKAGLFALEQADLFNLLCIPPYLPTGDIDGALIDTAAVYCAKRRAMFLIDPPSGWLDKDKAKIGVDSEVGAASKNAAVYFPRLRQPNPLKDNQMEDFVPCGVVAGVFARTDTQRGVWKAPAGLDATMSGVPQLTVNLTDPENGELNMKGVNCLRVLPPAGRVIWGARTRVGDDKLANEWKYVPVRRTALFIEESLYRGLQWVVFEPNDEPLWAQIRLNAGAFMNNLFRQGAFQGSTPRDAYFVKCDKETTTQNDINLGIVNVVVGFAPLKPAEFVIVKIQQMAGQVQS